MNEKKSASISRREFARRAALTSAAALVPARVLAVEEPQPPPSPAQDSGNQPKLSPQSQAEADARFQAILAQYGSRFSPAQQAELHRLCRTAQPGLDHLRAYAISNGDAPDLYLKPLVERDRKRR